MSSLLATAFVLLSGCTSTAPVSFTGTVFDDSALAPWIDAPIPADARFAADRVIVGVASMEIPEILEEADLTATRGRILEHVNGAVFDLPAGTDVPAAVEALRESGRFTFVEPDYVHEVAGTFAAADPYRPWQWNLDALGAEAAWGMSTGVGMNVAVLDTGVSGSPEDGLTWLLRGTDLVNKDWDAADDNGHGTHVASVIGQRSMNGLGIAGMAFNASILPIKVADASGHAFSSDIAAGIDLARQSASHVICLSLTSPAPSLAEAAAVLDAWESGIFVAAAAGNDGSAQVAYPAAFDGAVAVGATRVDDSVAPYSNEGSALDLVAPGGDLGEDLDGDGYVDGILGETLDPDSGSFGLYMAEGTSMATPHAAAAAALLMSQGASAAEALDLLAATALDLEGAGWDGASGAGLIQPADALDSLIRTDRTGPAISGVSEVLSAPGRYTISWITDELASSLVCDRSLSACRGASSERVADHAVTVRGRRGELYFVKSVDPAGNESVEGPFRF